MSSDAGEADASMSHVGTSHNPADYSRDALMELVLGDDATLEQRRAGSREWLTQAGPDMVWACRDKNHIPDPPGPARRPTSTGEAVLAALRDLLVGLPHETRASLDRFAARPFFACVDRADIAQLEHAGLVLVERRRGSPRRGQHVRLTPHAHAAVILHERETIAEEVKLLAAVATELQVRAADHSKWTRSLSQDAGWWCEVRHRKSITVQVQCDAAVLYAQSRVVMDALRRVRAPTLPLPLPHS